MTRVSFIVPTFNRERFIVDSINSIMGEMSIDDELIVVDDGSTDRTAEIVGSFGAALRYVNQENSGKAAALNKAILLSSGEFIWICDDDDILMEGSVSKLYNAINNSEFDLVFGKYVRFIDGVNRTYIGTGYWPDLSGGSLRRHILEDAFVMQNAALVRRSAYDRVGPFDEAMPRSLDYEMFVRLALSCSIGFLDEIVFAQRKHDGPRGPGQQLHAAVRSEEVWLKYDSKIFERVAGQTPIAAYEGMFSGDPKIVRRAALLQRACVMARHDIWHRAIEDLEAAAAIEAGSLTSCELQVASRILNGKHDFKGALQAHIVERLRNLRKAGGNGKSIQLALLRGGFWRLRSREPSAVTYRRLLLATGGVVRAALLVLEKALRFSEVSVGDSNKLSEREVPLGNWPIDITPA